MIAEQQDTDPGFRQSLLYFGMKFVTNSNFFLVPPEDFFDALDCTECTQDLIPDILVRTAIADEDLRTCHGRLPPSLERGTIPIRLTFITLLGSVNPDHFMVGQYLLR